MRNCAHFRCDECDYRTTKGALIRIHIQKKHNVKNQEICVVPATPKNVQTLKCELCDYPFACLDLVKAHVKNMHGNNVNKNIKKENV